MVLAVGQRAFINSPYDATTRVALTDERGVPGATALLDGTEVEVIAWRPRGSTGTRYRVCDRAAGGDGWLAADELRKTVIRPVTDPPPAPNPESGYRRFGSGI
jgi:hypothetical protein